MADGHRQLTMAGSLVHRVAARDRALFDRLCLDANARHLVRIAWSIATQVGGAAVTMLASVIPLFAEGSLRVGARRATILLVVSHMLVQLVKRTVDRPRPVFPDGRTVRAPDRFSFPSGHAAAALSVAIGYASVHPGLAVPLLLVAWTAGVSRVVLGVHFPADVVAGQALAVLTAVAVAPIL